MSSGIGLSCACAVSCHDHGRGRTKPISNPSSDTPSVSSWVVYRNMADPEPIYIDFTVTIPRICATQRLDLEP